MSLIRTAILLTATIVVVTCRVHPYEILGLTSQASRQQVKKAFKVLSRQYHPDRMPDDPDHKQRYHNIVQAYELIKQQWLEEERQPNFIQSNPNNYINIDDLLNQMEWQMHQESSNSKYKPKGFIQWCVDNPQIVLAALCLSVGLVLSCK